MKQIVIDMSYLYSGKTTLNIPDELLANKTEKEQKQIAYRYATEHFSEIPMTKHVAYVPDSDRFNEDDVTIIDGPKYVTPEKTKYKAVDIEWDTDGEDVDLPSEIDIPNDLTDEDDISDYISNQTGFCHNGFHIIRNNPATQFDPILYQKVNNKR